MHHDQPQKSYISLTQGQRETHLSSFQIQSINNHHPKVLILFAILLSL